MFCEKTAQAQSGQAVTFRSQSAAASNISENDACSSSAQVRRSEPQLNELPELQLLNTVANIERRKRQAPQAPQKTTHCLSLSLSPLVVAILSRRHAAGQHC